MQNPDAVQGNESKQVVRDSIIQQVVNFHAHTRQPISAIELPASEWLFTKALLKKFGTATTQVLGMENSHLYDEWSPVFKGMPIVKGVGCIRGDIDARIHREGERFNILFPDYCCNPAHMDSEVQERNAEGVPMYWVGSGKPAMLRRYSYPQLNTFINFVRHAKHQAVYYMTFYCNGRGCGGIDALIKAMSPNAKNVASAICNKISMMLSQAGLAGKAKRILKITYSGSTGSSKMVTIGFAVNCDFDIPAINLHIPGPAEQRDAQPNNPLDLRKRAMLTLLGAKKFTNAEIAEVLGVKPMNVGAIAAHITRGNLKFAA